MLAIQVEFLLGRYFAADFRDESVPEWPPAPDRLFEALTAAHHDTFATEGERNALLWFERLSAPSICAGEKGNPQAVVNFVPTNYDGTKSRSPHPDQRGKQPRAFPVHGPSKPVVYFVWPQAEPDAPTRALLSSLLGRVPSLGRACSLVRASLADSAESPNWAPDSRGRHSLRIFGEGRLEELESLYQMNRRPSLGPQTRYAEVTEPRSQCAGSFGEMIVLRKIEGRPLPVEAALTLTTATRKALMSQASAIGEQALVEMIGGHGEHPRCAVVALPFVGHEHADGRLMGIAVVLARDIAPAERRKLIRLCSGLETINLRERESYWKVELSGFDLPRVALNPATWMKASTTWASVTPVLLDQFPRKSKPTEEILTVACERIGLPVPIQIEHGPYSDMPGVSPVTAFRTKRKSGEQPRWAVHVKLRFPTPVLGPVLLGAGRFFGMGLLKPWQWRDDVQESTNDPE